MLSAKLVALPLLASLAFGCDNNSDAKASADKKAAEAAKEEAETEKRIEERKQKRLAEEQAKLDEAAKLQAAVDAVCVLPETLPKKLDKACAAVSAAHDGFMLRLYGDNPETVEKWNGGKGTQLPMTVAQCTKAGSLEVAACQAHALETATVEIKKELPAIFRTCIEKFGTPADPAAQ